MSEDIPTIEVNGMTVQLYNDEDVLNVFEEQAGFGIGDQVEELIVDTIDAELSYHNTHEHYVLRCYVYFNPLEAVNTGSVRDDQITVDGWERESQLLSDDQLGIVYKRTLQPDD